MSDGGLAAGLNSAPGYILGADLAGLLPEHITQLASIARCLGTLGWINLTILTLSLQDVG